jgi:hypothetical protein
VGRERGRLDDVAAGAGGWVGEASAGGAVHHGQRQFQCRDGIGGGSARAWLVLACARSGREGAVGMCRAEGVAGGR